MTAREKALEEACRALVEHDDQLRALCAKRTSSWRTVLEWYRAHPADSDVIAAARTALSLPPAPAGGMREEERIDGEVIAGNVGKERTTLTVRIPGRHALLGPVTLVRRLRARDGGEGPSHG